MNRNISTTVGLIIISLMALGVGYVVFQSGKNAENNVSTILPTQPVETKKATTSPADPTPTKSVITLRKDYVCPDITNDLTMGSVDEKINGPEYFKGQVSNLQTFFVQYFSITDSNFVDGIFGPITEKYVQQFQAAEKLSATGKVDTITRSHILALCTATAIPIQNIKILPNSLPSSITLDPLQGLQESGNLTKGGFRIEYLNKDTHTIRVTGRTILGIGTQTISLNEKPIITNNWPLALEISFQKVNADGSISLDLKTVSTD